MSHMNYTPDELLSVMLSKESVDAERRGAIKALREAADDAETGEVADWLDDRADRIEEEL